MVGTDPCQCYLQSLFNLHGSGLILMTNFQVLTKLWHWWRFSRQSQEGL